MWTCKACGLGMMFKAVTPEIDEDGCYFLCVGCGQRNVLVNVGAERGEIALAQPKD